MLDSVARVEDIVKVHEARLTEKETTSLSPSEVEDYMLTLQVFYKIYYIFIQFISCKNHCSFWVLFYFLHVLHK